MNKEFKSLVFSSSIDNLCDLNSSFAKGVMRIAYHGENRNGTFISKEDFEKAIPTIYNVPIVCRYDREDDAIGAHDMQVVKKDDALMLINMTDPVGVVPESAQVYWQSFTEEDGVVHEYLCADVLLWKRQEAYFHIRDNGITGESMEIDVFDGGTLDDGLYHINNFQFTAFCLLESATPCFESASVELFALENFKTKYAQMMEDIKREFSTSTLAKGGNDHLKLNELLEKYGLVESDIDFEMTDEMTEEEIEKRFADIRDKKTAVTTDPVDPVTAQFDEDPDPSDDDDDDDDDAETTEDDSDTTTDEVGDEQNSNGKVVRDYSLTVNQLMHEIVNQLDAQRFIDRWGDNVCRYCLCDVDYDAQELYAEDRKDNWNVYGLKFAIENDAVTIDFASAKRKKVQYVDFEPGEAENAAFDMAAVEDEIRTNARKRIAGENAIFDKFSDLVGNTMLDELKNNCDKYTLEQLEEKCYAIRGRSQAANFSLSYSQRLRMPAGNGQHNQNADEPYGGAFQRYLGKK